MARAGEGEAGKRSVVGWVVVGLFLVWNAFMLFAALGALAAGRTVPKEPAMAAAQSVGASLGMGVILILWATGAAILGVLILMTRGSAHGGG